MHALIFGLILSAPGQVMWVGAPSDAMEVTPTEVALYGKATDGAFGVKEDNLESEHCWQNTKEQLQTPAQVVAWTCEVGGRVVLTDDQYWAATLAKILKDPSAATLIATNSKMLIEANLPDHEALTQALWHEPLTKIHSFRLWKKDGKTYARHWPIVQGTVAQFRAAATAKPSQVTFPVGRVP